MLWFRKKRLKTYKNNTYLKFLNIFIFSLILVSAFYFYIIINTKFNNTPKLQELYDCWNEQNYQCVYKNASLFLEINPLNGNVLALRGFSAYYLSLQQLDSTASSELINEAILDLRNSWFRVRDADKAQVAYILGKAYYQKGFYYSDLALKYLDFAHDYGLNYVDLDEFRGMSAFLLGNYQDSIESFTSALINNPSDLLLYALSLNYIELNDFEKAKQYLLEALRVSNDELFELKCRNKIANILLKEMKVDEALEHITIILKKDSNYADAHYTLGVIYEMNGDMVKARSQWRKAISINPVHTEARQKLNI